MRVSHIEDSPFDELPHLIAAGRGRTSSVRLLLFRGEVDTLPDELDAIVIASDLQGVAPLSTRGGAVRLVGEVLAQKLRSLAERGALPPPSRTGVILAGDLYSAPDADVRGATGDVREVWRAFAAAHRWVIGVAGNHDTFGTPAEVNQFMAEPGMALLDGTVVERGGLRVGGVGGIIGNARRPGRREERAFLRSMAAVLSEAPAVLVLHQGPDAERGALRGHPSVRQALDRSGPLLVVCGHVYWPQPLADLRGGAQALNADGRVVVLTRGAPQEPASLRTDGSA